MAPALSLLFLVSSLWVVSSVPLMPAAAADGQGGYHCPSVLCGNVTISYPFGLLQENNPQTNCGWTGFQVRCRDSTPYLAYYQSELGMQILSISYDNGSLLIAETRNKQGEYFNTSSPGGCHIPTANASSELVAPFSISPVNQNLIFYNCTKPLTPGGGPVETICRSNTYVRVAIERSFEFRSYFLEGCNATVMPVLGRSVKTEASNYEELIRDGFLVTWQWPPSGSKRGAGKIIRIVLMAATASLLFPCIYVMVCHRKRQRLRLLLGKNAISSNERNIEALIVSYGSLAPKRYSYSE